VHSTLIMAVAVAVAAELAPAVAAVPAEVMAETAMLELQEITDSLPQTHHSIAPVEVEAVALEETEV
jgi:hypothetical protein